jgi:hypothetical protein
VHNNNNSFTELKSFMLHSYENIQNMRTVKKGTAKVAKLKQIK